MRRDRRRVTSFSPATLTLAATFAIGMGVLLSIVGNTNAFGAAAPGFSPCLPGSQPIFVHYTFDANPAGPAEGGLDTYTLAGFDSACDGDTVTITIRGNALGDPAQPATETLATYDTTVDPCTQQPAANPATVRHGEIVVRRCPAEGRGAGRANLHDATKIDVEVRGEVLPSRVLGETFTSGGPAAVRPSVLDGVVMRAQLPFTGTYAALMVWLGLALLTGGLVVLVVGRRRPSRQIGS